MSNLADIPYESLIRIGKRPETDDFPKTAEIYKNSENISSDEIFQHIERDVRRYIRILGR